MANKFCKIRLFKDSSDEDLIPVEILYWGTSLADVYVVELNIELKHPITVVFCKEIKTGGVQGYMPEQLQFEPE